MPTFILTLLLIFFLPQLTLAVEKNFAEGLFKPDIFCARAYKYKNQTYSLDSSRKQDGEGLRKVFTPESAAMRMLNEYQTNTRNMARWPAYSGTLGLAVFIGGWFYSGTLETAGDQRNVRYIAALSGALITIGSYWYGRYSLKANEKRLVNAIEHYNSEVQPSERIHIELAPVSSEHGIRGGAIRTRVQF